MRTAIGIRNAQPATSDGNRPAPTVWFDSMRQTAGVLSDENRDLLRLIRVLQPRTVRLSALELTAVVSALSERDETAEICRNRDGEAEPDAELRDTENVPLTQIIRAYFGREVLPHVPVPGTTTARPSSAMRFRSTATSTATNCRASWP